MKQEDYLGEIGEVYQVRYALYSKRSSFLDSTPSSDEETFCAWCNKSVAEIKKTEDLDSHLENHDKEESQ